MNSNRIKKLEIVLICTLFFTSVFAMPGKFNLTKNDIAFADTTDDASIINNVQADFTQLDSEMAIKNINWTILDNASDLLNKLNDTNSSKAGLLQELDVYRVKLTIASLSSNSPLEDYDRIKLQINNLQADTSTKQDLLNSLAAQSDKRITDMITPIYNYAYDKMTSSDVTSSVVHDTYVALENIVSLLSHITLDENKNNIIGMITPLITAYNSRAGYYFDINYELNQIANNNASSATGGSANTGTSTTNTGTSNTNTQTSTTNVYSVTPMGNAVNSSGFILKDPVFQNGDNLTVTLFISGAGNVADNINYNRDTGIEVLLNEEQYNKLYKGNYNFYLDVKGPNYTRDYNITYTKDSSVIPILKPTDLGSIAATKVNKSMNTFDIADLVLDDRSSFDYVVIASKNSYADCLSGAMLSTRLDAPILMVDDSDITTLKSYLAKRMNKSGTIYILGGEGVVSKTIENAVSVYGSVKRLGGTDRFDTNKKILDAMELKTYSEIIITSGNAFSDAVSASTASGKYNAPIILANTNGLNTDMLNKIEQIKPTKVTIVGGTAAVSPVVENQLAAIGIKNITRINGADREKTSMSLINSYFRTSLNTVFLIDTNDFALGMSLAPLTAMSSSAIVVNMSNDMDYIKTEVQANNYIDLTNH